MRLGRWKGTSVSRVLPPDAKLGELQVKRTREFHSEARRSSLPTTSPTTPAANESTLRHSSRHTTTKMASVQSVQCFGKKKTATAVAHCKQGQGLIKVNGQPLSLVEPAVLRFKVYEPVLLLGLDKFGTCV